MIAISDRMKMIASSPRQRHQVCPATRPPHTVECLITFIALHNLYEHAALPFRHYRSFRLHFASADVGDL